MMAVTKSEKCKTIAERWARQYPSHKRSEDKTAVYEQLVGLQGCGTEEQIDSIIGNRSWTRNACTECDKDSQTLIRLGDEPDYDSSTVWICLTCLKVAVKLARATGKQRARMTLS